MKKQFQFLQISFLVLILGACTSIKGYQIKGTASLPVFEGRMVYLKDAYNNVTYDSARITKGQFAFADTAEVAEPQVSILSIHTKDASLEYRLPIVIENGVIEATISNVVSTGGTPLNDDMQDFLLTIDAYSATCIDKSLEQIKSGFTALLKQSIEKNKDNIISAYITKAYQEALEQ